MSAEPNAPNGSLSEREAQAAEYVLGTLTAEERASIEAARGSDPSIDAAIRDWERRLAPLGLSIPEEHPPAGLYDGIVRRIRRSSTGTRPAANDDRIVSLTRQLRRWRLAAGGAGLMAAGLALALALALTLGPHPSTSADSARYVAVVTSGGVAPALIVSVDTGRGTAQVRPVAVQAPVGKSLELWYVGGGKPPRSLGLLGVDASRVGLPGEAASGAGMFAVSVEPPGGSPTGQPTGQVIYQGKLIRE